MSDPQKDVAHVDRVPDIAQQATGGKNTLVSALNDWREIAWEAGENPRCDLVEVIVTGNALADAIARQWQPIEAASPTQDREQRRIVLSLLVEVSRGMSPDRLLAWFEFIRRDLERICWGAEDDDMFMVLRVDLPGRTLTLSPAAGEAPTVDAGRLSPDAETIKSLA